MRLFVRTGLQAQDSRRCAVGLRGPSDFDRTQRLVFNSVYELPLVTRGPAAARAVLSHWSVSGILVAGAEFGGKRGQLGGAKNSFT